MDPRRTTFLGTSDHVYVKTKYSNKNIVFSTDNALLISFYSSLFRTFDEASENVLND